MSSTDTMKDGKDNNIDAAITEETKSVAMSDDSKKNTDKKCTSYEQNTTMDNITEDLNSVAIRNDTSVCGNCGKEGSDVNNICNKCKQVLYCNAACKKKHRHKHKKVCERRVAELHDEELFKEPPPPEECPICLLPLSNDEKQEVFQVCCGKRICNGCCYAMALQGGKHLCAFCRIPASRQDEEIIKQTKNLMDKGIGYAFYLFASYYARGIYGLQQDYQKTNELLLKAAELGCAKGYNKLGNAYNFGRGVERDAKQAKYYWELAAMGGYVDARYNLGCVEYKAGNHHRAFKHWLIAARAGCKESLDNVTRGFKDGFVTKDGYASTMRAYQTSRDDVKSDARDKVARIMQENPLYFTNQPY